MVCFNLNDFETVNGALSPRDFTGYRKVASQTVVGTGKYNLSNTPSTMLQDLNFTWNNPYPVTMRVLPFLFVGTEKITTTSGTNAFIRLMSAHTNDGTAPVPVNVGTWGGGNWGGVNPTGDYAGFSSFLVTEVDEPARVFNAIDNSKATVPVAGSYKIRAQQLVLISGWESNIHASFVSEMENWIELGELRVDLYAWAV